MKKHDNARYQETYYEETMENGLRVVLWHKPGYARSLFMMATPLGALDVWQEDAAGREYTYPAGIAHFLEHKMFEKKDHDVMDDFSRMGANVNAFTSYGETAYYFSTSEEAVAKPLELLLDFVQELDISDASVEKEKGIIVSELNMYLQMSETRLLMETFRSLYHQHPLRFDIGGDEESVRSTTREQLEACYQRNYHPQTMLLAGVSGQDPAALMEIIRANQQRKRFAALAAIHRRPAAEPQSVVRPYYAFEMDITVPKVCVAYKLDAQPDVRERLRQEWSLRLALDLYFSSLHPDYQTWLDQKIISDYVTADTLLGEDYGCVLFSAESEREEEFIHLVSEVCARMKKADIEEVQLESLKRRYYGQAVRSLNSFDEIAIGYIRSSFSGMDYLESMDLIETIDAEDIRKACAQLEETRRAIVVINPQN